MSIDRYQMALEIIAMSQYTQEGDIARLALRVAERPVVAALPEPDCEPEPEPEPEPASQIPPMVHNGRPYVPIVVPEPEPDVDDEPEAIDLDEIDAELDAEEAEKPEPPAVGRDGLTATQTRALDLIREVGAISPGALSVHLGISEQARKRAIRALVERNLITVTGSTSRTMYHRDVEDKPTMPAEPPAPENGAGGDRAVLTRQPKVVLPDPDSKRRQEPPVEGRVLAEVRFKPGTISTIAHKLSLPVDDVAIAIRKLEREGEVKASAASGAVVWSRA